jgi:branched-chain amino acid transport system ATP-binding protein
VLLVEQNTHMVLSLAHRGYVLETGRLVVQGKPEELRDNEDVRTAYLGGRRSVTSAPVEISQNPAAVGLCGRASAGRRR